jgi:hypothetical protein
MTIHITPDNKLHDDADGFALTLPSWPQDARLATEEEIETITNPPKTLEQATAIFEGKVQEHLDDEARLLGYDNILSACSYAAAPNPFQNEAITFVTWRGAVWEYCYAELAKVVAGTRTMPTVAEIISELPKR